MQSSSPDEARSVREDQVSPTLATFRSRVGNPSPRFRDDDYERFIESQVGTHDVDLYVAGGRSPRQLRELRTLIDRVCAELVRWCGQSTRIRSVRMGLNDNNVTVAVCLGDEDLDMSFQQDAYRLAQRITSAYSFRLNLMVFPKSETDRKEQFLGMHVVPIYDNPTPDATSHR